MMCVIISSRQCIKDYSLSFVSSQILYNTLNFGMRVYSKFYLNLFSIIYNSSRRLAATFSIMLSTCKRYKKRSRQKKVESNFRNCVTQLGHWRNLVERSLGQQCFLSDRLYTKKSKKPRTYQYACGNLGTLFCTLQHASDKPVDSNKYFHDMELYLF